MVGLFTTVNQAFQRVAMHAVRVELLCEQAAALGLPLRQLSIPYPCSNEDYASRMAEFVSAYRADGVSHMAFGDLFLEDVRAPTASAIWPAAALSRSFRCGACPPPSWRRPCCAAA